MSDQDSIIRVFPRRTRWTPQDKLVFIGDPPLFRPKEGPVRISCTFSWDLQECERLYRSWSRFYEDVELGGPALGDPGGEFMPGRYVKAGVIITSRGCSKDCPWCFVPPREGWIRELEIKEGWDVIDNNLLACSQGHIERVFEMLRRQPEPIRFSGGLDTDLLQPWHIDLLKTIRLKYAWFACDNIGAIERLRKAADLMSDFSVEKKRCYVLIGFAGESLRAAEKRLETVFKLGFLPMAMLYRPENDGRHGAEWRALQKLWSRPAMYKAHMKLKETK